MDYFLNFLNAISDHVVIPLIIAFGAAMLFVFKDRFDKIAKSIVAKNELSEMEKETNIRKQLLETIDNQVKAAVASNMSIANEMKNNGEKLSEDQIRKLNDSAKRLVLNSLPPSLTENNGVLLEIIGGRDKLEGVIEVMLEKHVYEYKIAQMKRQQYFQKVDNPYEEHSIPRRPIR